MSTSRRVAKNFLSLSLAEIASRFLGAFLTFYVARELGASVFGQFSFAIAFISFFNIFVDFGLTTLGIRDIAQDKSRTPIYGTNILALQLLISGGLILLLVGLLAILPLDINTKLITFLFGLGVLPTALNMSYILQAHERMEFVAISRVVGQVGYALFGFIVIYATKDIIWLPIVQVLSAIIWLLAAYYFIRKYINFHFDQVNWVEIKRLAKLSLPFFISAVAVQIYYNIDSVLLQFMRSQAEVGYYNAGYKIVLLVILIGTFLMNVFFPILASSWKNNRELFDKTLHFAARAMGILAFPVTVGGIMLAEPLILYVYKKSEYLASVESFQLLLLLPLLIFFNVVRGNALVAAGYQKINTVAVVIGAVVNLVLNIILIPLYGISGAAMATVIAELAVLFYVMPKFGNQIVLPIWRDFCVRPLVSTLAMAVVLFSLPDSFHILVKLAAGFITYIVVLLLVKGVTREEVAMVIRKSDVSV